MRAGQAVLRGSSPGTGSVLDLDPAGAGLGRFGQAHGENAVGELSVDLLWVGVRGQAGALR
jgi:hypothetical protein